MKKTFQYGGIDIDIINSKSNKVPTEAHEIILKEEDAKSLAVAINQNIACLISGESGIGKTSAVKYLAFKRKQGYVRINMHGYATPDELIGTKSIKDGTTYYENGILTNAMINGDIVVLDELNATPPDCTFIIHGLLDDDRQISLPNGDVIKPHKDFRFFATLNPDYEGTRGLNRALLDRFGIVITVEIPEPDTETKILVDRLGIEEKVAKNMIETAWLGRKNYQEGKSMTLITTRGLLQWAELIKGGMDNQTAYIKAVANKAHQNDRSAFVDFFNAVFQLDSKGEQLSNAPVLLTKEEHEKMVREIDDSKQTISNYKNDIDTIKSRNEKLTEENKQYSITKKNYDELVAKIKQVTEIPTETPEVKSDKDVVAETTEVKEVEDTVMTF